MAAFRQAICGLSVRNRPSRLEGGAVAILRPSVQSAFRTPPVIPVRSHQSQWWCPARKSLERAWLVEND
jgi:hypothetical protein